MMPDWIGERTIYPRWLGVTEVVRKLFRPILLLVDNSKTLLNINNNPIIIYIQKRLG